MSIELRSGNIKLVDNSELRYDGRLEKIKLFREPISFVSVGCFYKNSGNTLYMSMYGRVADFQMFSNLLSDSEMKAYTSCRKRLIGNLLPWDTTEWKTSGSKPTIRNESIDWCSICNLRNRSLFCCASFIE